MVCFVLSTQAKPIFVRSQSSSNSDDFKHVVAAFLEGFNFGIYANVSEGCQSECDKFSAKIQDGFEKIGNKEFYNGTVAITDAFGVMSPLSRSCESTTTPLNKVFKKYKKHFKDPSDFFDKISVNALKNLNYIKKDFGLMMANFISSPNYTYISGLAGEITRYTFVLEKEDPLIGDYEVVEDLQYLDSDPLSAIPMEKGIWTVLEGTFKFLLNSRLATKAATQDCQEGTINFVYFNDHAKKFHKKNKSKQAWFAFADGKVIILLMNF